MTEPSTRLRPSVIDSERFELPVARLDVAPGGGGGAVRDALTGGADWRLLIARCEADDLAAAAALEALGARLMDVHLTFERALANDGPGTPRPTADVDEVEIRPAGPDEADEIAGLFELAFATYAGHYHADPRLDDERCAAIYADWAGRLVRGGEGIRTLLVRGGDGSVLGATIVTHEVGSDVAHGVLDAVHPAARGRGLYRLLGRERVRVAGALGAQRLRVSTHLQNLLTCRNLGRLGFLPVRAQLTFHAWND